MRIEKFLEFNRNSIEYEIIQNPITSFTLDSFIQAFADSVNQLKQVRNSRMMTIYFVKDIFNKFKKKKVYRSYFSEDGSIVDSDVRNEVTVEYGLIKLWLFRFCDKNDSYYHAYNAIVPYYNENGCFPVDLKSMSDEELFNAIELDDELIRKKDNSSCFIVDTNLLHKVYVLCNDETFECTEPDFIQCVANADFSNLTIKKIANFKYLIYKLSSSMHSEWYETAAKSKGWTKGQCSGTKNNLTKQFLDDLIDITGQ